MGRQPSAQPEQYYCGLASALQDPALRAKERPYAKKQSAAGTVGDWTRARIVQACAPGTTVWLLVRRWCAFAAYQVGCLQSDQRAFARINQVSNPFPVICGTSAGQFNALALGDQLRPIQTYAVQRMQAVLVNFRCHQSIGPTGPAGYWLRRLRWTGANLMGVG